MCGTTIVASRKKKEEELRELRPALNHRVISKLKPSEHSQQIMDKMLEDYAEGAIERLVPIGHVDLEKVSLTRVIPVEQYDADGNLKMRGLVHCTESGGNPAISPCDRIQTEGLDWLVCMVLWCFFHGHEVVLPKRDVKRAFKTCPLFFGHAEFAWVLA